LRFKKIPLFRTRPFAASNEKLWFFARSRGCAVMQSCGRAAARSHTRTHAQRQLFIFYQIWGKQFLSKKKYLGKTTQKTSGILYMRESKIQLLLELDLIDGDLIIYAEFDKTWYKR
jgi:hypothetical protein